MIMQIASLYLYSITITKSATNVTNEQPLFLLVQNNLKDNERKQRMKVKSS